MSMLTSTNDLILIMEQVNNVRLSIAERDLIAWLMDQGIHELRHRETHQLVLFPVRLAYNASPKKNGRVLLPGEKI